MSQNQYPSHEQASSPTQEFIQYNDNELAIGYQTPGDTIVMGDEATFKYGRDFHGGDIAIMTTESGNVYTIGGGVAINKDRGTYTPLPKDGFTVKATIGESCVIPGVATTTEVKGVMLRYKIAPPNYGGAQQIDQLSPFALAQKQLDLIRASHGSRR